LLLRSMGSGFSPPGKPPQPLDGCGFLLRTPAPPSAGLWERVLAFAISWIEPRCPYWNNYKLRTYKNQPTRRMAALCASNAILPCYDETRSSLPFRVGNVLAVTHHSSLLPAPNPYPLIPRLSTIAFLPHPSLISYPLKTLRDQIRAGAPCYRSIINP
jgi:hypothetical protein